MYNNRTRHTRLDSFDHMDSFLSIEPFFNFITQINLLDPSDSQARSLLSY